MPATLSAIGSSRARSDSVSVMRVAAVFSSTRDGLRVPGMGTTGRSRTVACWWTQARAICAGVAPWDSATVRTGSSRAALAAALSPVKRGIVRRKSSCVRSFEASEKAPVRKPRPSGEYGTRVTPRSRAAGTTAASMSRLNSDHSDCTAAIGCTACAARSSAAVTSLRPSCFTLPSRTSSAMTPTVSSIGTFTSRRCM
ncbi:hypothetical protein SALBM217S_05301 [Streptomyces griseoloalbus]